MAAVRFATREDVKRALDSAETARDNARVDAALDGATDSIHGLTQRRFAPEIRTVTFDWPDMVQRNKSWRLWLDRNEIISVTSFVSGGVTIPVANLKLYPNSGPPYNRIEIDLGSSSAFTATTTYQQANVLTGLFAGVPVVETAAGLLNGAVSSTAATTITVTDSAAIGVGTLMRVDTERMNVVGKMMAATGQTLQGALTDRANVQTVAVTNGVAYAVGETILIDAERMLIVEIAANNLIVKRGWDGSTLAVHNVGATIYAPRTLTVQRGVLGTTAATHADQAPIVAWQPPGVVRSLAIAESLLTLTQQSAGYAMEVRAGSSGGRRLINNVQELRDQVLTMFGRQARTRAV